MKTKLTILILALTTFLAGAQTLQLAWDASIDVGATNYTYILYSHTNTLTSTTTNYTVKVNAGTNLTATIEDLAPGRWYFAVTARDTNGVQSDFSNVLPYQIPSPPPNLRTVILQYSASVTNFQDMIFFKLRFP